MNTRKLGNIEVSSIVMGCMGFTHAYGKAPDENEGIRLVHLAFDRGCNFFDTAEMYSYFGNEAFVGKALKGLPRDKVVISDKFWPEKFNGHDFPEDKLSEAGIRKTLEGQLRRLGTDYIDLYTEHQMRDGNEEAVAEVMGKLIKEGKIRAWGQAQPALSRRPRREMEVWQEIAKNAERGAGEACRHLRRRLIAALMPRKLDTIPIQN